LAQQDRVNIAVFIDFDNIEIGVRTTLNDHFDVGIILEALKERGEVVTKIAYADWTRAGEYSRALTQHAIRLVQRNLTPGGDKNGADINLALDALEMAFTHPHINAYVIVGGDSDFLSLVEKLKQYDKKVFVIGGRAFTSVILQRNCHEFIAYENLLRKPAPVRGGRPPAPTMASSPITQAFPIVRRALKILADREVSPQTGLLKSTLLQLDSTFSERNYGASSFLDFAEKLAQSGLVQLKHSGRSVMVELTPGFSDDGDSTPKPRATPEIDGGESGSIEAAPPFGQAGDVAQAFGGGADASQAARPMAESPARLGDNAEGVKVAAQHMASAVNARWPMYLRNVKQILRAAGYDERRYGFGGLLELLKACQREGFVRVERDRRGGLRVFQGTAMPRTPVASVTPTQVAATVSDPETIDAQNEAEPIEAEPIESETVTVVDTTAELLGRAKPKRPRTRATGAAFSESAASHSPSSHGLRGSRSTKAGAKKTVGTRRRTKKAGDGQ
jgi:uncharacterized protein (TIGR00288 family)